MDTYRRARRENDLVRTNPSHRFSAQLRESRLVDSLKKPFLVLFTDDRGNQVSAVTQWTTN
jgi:hypothetical protein